MKPNESFRYKLSDNQSSAVFNEGTIIINFEKGEYYTLDGVGYAIWEELKDSPKSIPELVDNIMSEFEVSQEKCSEDVGLLIRSLLAEELITEVY